MKRTIVCVAGALCLALMVAAVPARAMMIAAPPAGVRIATADLVVVGKVKDFGPRLVPADRFAGDKGQYQVANVLVGETLFGKSAARIKVGFVAPPPPPPPGGPGRPIRIGPRFRGVTLTVGQEACLILVKHPMKDFFVINAYYDVINLKDNPNFAKEKAEIAKAAKLLARPKEGLKAKDANDRLLTAALLITRYRTPKPFNPMPKTVAIDAAESKQVLETLANADWANVPGRNWAMNPQGLFFRLGVTPKDGWVQPKDFRQLPDEAKKWLKANAATYRIQKYVAGPAPKGAPPALPGGR